MERRQGRTGAALFAVLLTLPGIVYLLSFGAEELGIPTKPVEIPLVALGTLSPIGIVGAVAILLSVGKSNSTRANLGLVLLIMLSVWGAWLRWRVAYYFW